MRIAFDAKRAFHNATGLGHYSRTLLQSLSTYYPENQYKLYNPYPATAFTIQGPGLEEVLPTRWLDKRLPHYWRSSRCIADLVRQQTAIYHGLSHEIPWGISKKNIATVVTMHDLIFERYPHQYNSVDRFIYRKKFKYACTHADHIIAISQQTKEDLINMYHTPEQKITVCYQSCNPAFNTVVTPAEKEKVQAKYKLPSAFFLSVGSIIERKNLLAICQALHQLNEADRLPLVVIGNGGAYKKKVQAFITAHQLEKWVIFLSDQVATQHDMGFTTAADFPAIYQLATALVYPSFFEGFGIPVLEGISSGIPVITSTQSCLPEAGGPGAFYADPYDPSSIAEQLHIVSTQPSTVQQQIKIGKTHAAQFSPALTAAAVMKIYQSLR
jgi:glycosyltransferase involved in cell wall biosynthesis